MTALFKSFIILFTVLLATPVTASTSAPTIVVMGDSLSAGYGLDPTTGWVELLRQRLQQQSFNYRVVNASITGDTTRGGLSRLPQTLQREKPAIVIIELGGNDGLRGFSLKFTRDNLSRMITLSQQANAKVLLLGVQLPANYGKQFRNKFQQIFVDLANQHQIASVPFFLEGVAETRELMQPDGIHPSEQAQPVILNNVWPALQPLLTIQKAQAE